MPNRYANVTGRVQRVRSCKHWTPTEDDRLVREVETGYSWAEIGRKHRRTKRAVKWRWHMVVHKRIEAAAYLTGADVARLMGVSNDTALSWVRRGLLAGRFRGAWRGEGNGVCLVDRGDLDAFVESELAWPLYDPDAIVDPILRQHAIEARGGLRFLTVAETAPELGYSTQRTAELCREGVIRHIVGTVPGRGGRAYLVRSDWIEAARSRLAA